MEKKSPIQTLLDREMDRRQFLGFVGASALSVFGITAILKGLQDSHHRAAGYGGGGYGGKSSKALSGIKKRTL